MSIQTSPQEGLLQRQPALAVSGGTMLGILTINAVVSYGISITPDLKLLIIFIIGGLGPLISGLITHGKVFSPATVARMKSEADMVLHAAQQTPAPPSIIEQPPEK